MVLGAMVLLVFSSGVVILIYGPNMIAKTQNKTEHQIKEDRIKEHKIRDQRTMELRNNRTKITFYPKKNNENCKKAF
jgi:hypothetical protein